MAKKRYTPETIIRKLREAGGLQGQGHRPGAQAVGHTEQIFSRWRKEYGGMRVGQANRLKALEAEDVPWK